MSLPSPPLPRGLIKPRLSIRFTLSARLFTCHIPSANLTRRGIEFCGLNISIAEHLSCYCVRNVRGPQGTNCSSWSSRSSYGYEDGEASSCRRPHLWNLCGHDGRWARDRHTGSDSRSRKKPTEPEDNGQARSLLCCSTRKRGQEDRNR